MDGSMATTIKPGRARAPGSRTRREVGNTARPVKGQVFDAYENVKGVKGATFSCEGSKSMNGLGM